jgi:phosphoglycolate phosphatase-like HAD superfamily hydrolase
MLETNLPLVVGFDLDMTLIDPRRSVRMALSALVEDTGVAIDIEHIVLTLGPPLEETLSPWFKGEELNEACWRYRELHGAVLDDQTDPMPGAVEAVNTVKDLGGRTVVVTAKYEPHAQASLKSVGIVADAVIGWRYGAAKGQTLREYGAQVYVGDHPADVLAAQVGGAISVAVATGGTTASALDNAGADVVLTNLLDFPTWLRGWLLRETPKETR